MRTTGLGSMPGRDFRAATRVVADLSDELLAWPELPQRDESSAMIGRTLGLLAQPGELDTDGWRLAAGRGSAQERAARWWRTDLDDFEELTQGHEGTIKVAMAGPWTLAASVRLAYPTMNHVISDPGACRDIWQALAQGAADLAGRLRQRFGRPIIVQLDEPMIGAVLHGGLPTFSGLDRYRIPDLDEVLTSWRQLIGAARQVSGVEQVWLHCCGPDFDVDLAGRAGFDALALDTRFWDSALFEACQAWLADGHTIALGVVRTDQVSVPPTDRIVADALEILRRLELPAELLDAQVVLTPACGLGAWPMPDAAQLLQRLTQAAELVAERIRG
ncbi:MAG: hypothetical protein QM286_09530 [Acidobacteriota bacterium]|nr:hypothetical protein [Acidobacteriota bacterium]